LLRLTRCSRYRLVRGFAYLPVDATFVDLGPYRLLYTAVTTIYPRSTATGVGDPVGLRWGYASHYHSCLRCTITFTLSIYYHACGAILYDVTRCCSHGCYRTGRYSDLPRSLLTTFPTLHYDLRTNLPFLRTKFQDHDYRRTILLHTFPDITLLWGVDTTHRIPHTDLPVTLRFIC